MRKFEFLTKADLVDENGYHHFFDVVQQEYIDSLKAENERLKTELKKWEDRSKVVKDRFDGEVYEWGGNYYIVTPHLNVFVKGLLKENAKLKCLALHAMSELFYYKREYLEALPFNNDHEIEKYFNLWAKFSDAYCKAKKALREGK